MINTIMSYVEVELKSCTQSLVKDLAWWWFSVRENCKGEDLKYEESIIYKMLIKAIITVF